MSNLPSAVLDPFFTGKGNTATLSSSVDWLVTARARAGIGGDSGAAVCTSLVVSRLPGVNVSYRNNAPAPFVLLSNSLSVDETRYGWTAASGGIRTGGNWSVKAEYLRVMLGDTTVNVPFDPANSAFARQERSSVIRTSILFRAGINYKFGAGPRPLLI